MKEPPPSAVKTGAPTQTPFGCPMTRLFGATAVWNGPNQPILPTSVPVTKFVPVIVTAVPTGPDAGDRLVSVGANAPIKGTLKGIAARAHRAVRDAPIRRRRRVEHT